jgi:hypothetical protein
MREQDFCFLLDMYVFRNGDSLRRRRGRSLYVGAKFAAPQFQHEYIRDVTASRSLWTLCTLCHCAVLGNIYTRYTETFCQCRLMDVISWRWPLLILGAALIFRISMFFRRLFSSTYETSSCHDSLLLFWRLSLIALCVAIYKLINSACPSRNLKRVCLSASALSGNCFHLAPFQFTLGEFWISCLVWTIGARTRSISFLSSAWSVTQSESESESVWELP